MAQKNSHIYLLFKVFNSEICSSNMQHSSFELNYIYTSKNKKKKWQTTSTYLIWNRLVEPIL